MVDVQPDDLVSALSAGNYFLLTALTVLLVVGLLRKRWPDRFKGWVPWATAVVLGMAQAMALAAQSAHPPVGAKMWLQVVLGGGLSGVLSSGMQSGWKNRPGQTPKAVAVTTSEKAEIDKIVKRPPTLPPAE